MAFNTAGLTAYVEANSQAIATKAVAGAKTIALLIGSGNAQFGVKGSTAILSMDSDVNLQDGSACGRNPLGTTTLSDKKLEVVPLKDEQDICPKSLWNTFYGAMIAKGQSPSEDLTPEFAAQIMEVRSAKIAAENEKLVWKGDKSLTGTTNMKYVDGIIKQVSGATAVSATGSTIVEKLQAFVLGNATEVANSEDFYVWIGEDTHAQYLVALANKNIFQAADAKIVFGTTAKFQVTPGLNGTGKIFGMRLANIRFGMDGQGDSDTATLRYSTETTKWYMDYNFALGVTVIDVTEVKQATV